MRKPGYFPAILAGFPGRKPMGLCGLTTPFRGAECLDKELGKELGKENGPARADPLKMKLTIRSHEHQNNHRKAIMSYGFKLSRRLYALPQIVCTSWLVTEWPQTTNATE